MYVLMITKYYRFFFEHVINRELEFNLLLFYTGIYHNLVYKIFKLVDKMWYNIFKTYIIYNVKITRN